MASKTQSSLSNNFTEYVTSLSKEERRNLKDIIERQEKIEQLAEAQLCFDQTYTGPFTELHPKIIDCYTLNDYLTDVTVEMDGLTLYIDDGNDRSWIRCPKLDHYQMSRFEALQLPSTITYQEYRKFCYAALMSCYGNDKWKAEFTTNRDGMQVYKLSTPLFYTNEDGEDEYVYVERRLSEEEVVSKNTPLADYHQFVRVVLAACKEATVLPRAGTPRSVTFLERLVDNPNISWSTVELLEDLIDNTNSWAAMGACWLLLDEESRKIICEG